MKEKAPGEAAQVICALVVVCSYHATFRDYCFTTM